MRPTRLARSRSPSAAAAAAPSVAVFLSTKEVLSALRIMSTSAVERPRRESPAASAPALAGTSAVLGGVVVLNASVLGGVAGAPEGATVFVAGVVVPGPVAIGRAVTLKLEPPGSRVVSVTHLP